MHTPTAFETATVRELVALREQADKRAARVHGFAADLSAARAELAEATNRFAQTLSPQDAAALATAKRQAEDFETIFAALDELGGADVIRDNALRTPEAFALLAKGFTERAAAIERMTKPALREIGARCAQLTEDGVVWPQTEYDPQVRALRSFCESVTLALALAKEAGAYCEARGVGRGSARTPDSLFALLTSPLPVAPTVPTSIAA